MKASKFYTCTHFTNINILYCHGEYFHPGISFAKLLLYRDKQVMRTFHASQSHVSIFGNPIWDCNFIFLQNGSFYFLLHHNNIIEYDEIRCVFSDENGDQVLSKKINKVTINFVGEKYASVEALIEGGKMFEAAILGLYNICNNIFPIDYKELFFIGEAFRKAAMKYIAINLYLKFIPKKSDDIFYGHCFDLLCDALDYNREVIILLRHEVIVNGETHFLNTNLGHYHYLNGYPEKADACYIQSASFLREKKQRNIHFNNGVYTWRSFAFCNIVFANLNNYVEREVIKFKEIVVKKSKFTKAVHLLGCDDVYFTKFGNNIIYSSLLMGKDNIAIHIHVVNPSQNTLERLQKWAERTDCHVGFSVSTIYNAHRPFYASIRFLIASTIMEKYELPLFISDVDMLVMKPWEESIAFVQEADIGYMGDPDPDQLWIKFPPRRRPWDLPAAHMYFSTSPLAKECLRYIRCYINSVISFPEEGLWFTNWVIDQVALRRAIDFLVHNNSDVKIINMHLLKYAKSPANESKDVFSNRTQSPEPDSFSFL